MTPREKKKRDMQKRNRSRNREAKKQKDWKKERHHVNQMLDDFDNLSTEEIVGWHIEIEES